MPGLYGLADGVNRLPKKWVTPVSGVNRELKELWGLDGGVNRKIFSSAITWTCTYGWDSKSIYYRKNVSSSSGTLDVTASFSEPIYINRIVADVTCDMSDAICTVYYDDATESKVNVLDTNKKVTSVAAWGSYSGKYSGDTVLLQGTILIQSRDYGNFYLGSIGTSDQN